VYDCSCRESNNSANLIGCLTVDPPFHNDLCAILLQFRAHLYTFTADIEKAFLHVQLHESDREPAKWQDTNSELNIYRFAVVPLAQLVRDSSWTTQNPGIHWNTATDTLLLVIAWVAVKFGINTRSIVLKWVKFCKAKPSKISIYNATRVVFIPNFTAIPRLRYVCVELNPQKWSITLHRLPVP